MLPGIALAAFVVPLPTALVCVASVFLLALDLAEATTLAGDTASAGAEASPAFFAPFLIAFSVAPGFVSVLTVAFGTSASVSTGRISLGANSPAEAN